MNRSRCHITREVIDPASLLTNAASPSDGAVLLFLGVVRNQNQGREVGHLDYEAYEPMARSVLEQILDEASGKWGIGETQVVHRVGRLQIGDASVAIIVAAPHRGDAYSASRYIIDELKKRVPIWKREGYQDGDSEWLPGTAPEVAGHGGVDV
ncbi:molybdenum cofactor biosynthesis protein MoaE [soil metagenome]